jgi:hypothetical protein
MSRRNTDHVVLLDGVFACEHCGARYRMNVPCPVNVFTAAMQAYVSDHANCEPRAAAAAPGDQLDLLKDQKP